MRISKKPSQQSLPHGVTATSSPTQWSVLGMNVAVTCAGYFSSPDSSGRCLSSCAQDAVPRAGGQAAHLARRECVESPCVIRLPRAQNHAFEARIVGNKLHQ